jgi:hypothetical protein
MAKDYVEQHDEGYWFDELCRRARAANPLLYQKLDEARRHMTVRP